MYRRPKFLEALLEIRREMALEADYDVDLFVETARGKNGSENGTQLTEFSIVDEPIQLAKIKKRRREIQKR